MEGVAILGILGALVGVVSYIPYFRDMFRGKTRPHPFSWFVWGLVSSIAFLAQVTTGGGMGTWTTGITALACFTIAGLALYQGNRNIRTIDIVCFVGALIGIVLWQVTNNPLTAVVVMLAVHLLGFVPTYRKAYSLPGEETVLSYVLSLLKWGLGIVALASLSLTTVLFPAGVFIMNAVFIAMLLIRRRQLK